MGWLTMIGRWRNAMICVSWLGLCLYACQTERSPQHRKPNSTEKVEKVIDQFPHQASDSIKMNWIDERCAYYEQFEQFSTRFFRKDKQFIQGYYRRDSLYRIDFFDRHQFQYFLYNQRVISVSSSYFVPESGSCNGGLRKEKWYFDSLQVIGKKFQFTDHHFHCSFVPADSTVYRQTQEKLALILEQLASNTF